MIIMIVPKTVTIEAVAGLRIVAEHGCDPVLYEMAAKGFDVLDMPNSAESMRRRRDHYSKYHWAGGRHVG